LQQQFTIIGSVLFSENTKNKTTVADHHKYFSRKAFTLPRAAPGNLHKNLYKLLCHQCRSGRRLGIIADLTDQFICLGALS
jgi:hypothetical protein